MDSRPVGARLRSERVSSQSEVLLPGAQYINEPSWRYPTKWLNAPLFSRAECLDIMSLVGRGGVSESARVRQNGERTKVVQRLQRHARITWLNRIEAYEWIYSKIAQAVEITNTELWQFEIDYVGPLQLTAYPLFGHYGWHTDVGPGDNLTRKLSFSV